MNAGRRSPLWGRVIAWGVALALTGPLLPARAQDGSSHRPVSQSAPHRPLAAGRIAATFNFEERAINPLPIPMNWLRAQHDPSVRVRPGFPIWNEPALDYNSPATSGRGTVRLPVAGGSASLRLNPGVLPIFADGEYLVTAFVRTEGCVHSRARMVARLLDAAGEVIDMPLISSPLVRTDGEWQQIAVRLPSGTKGAAFVQLDLELVQPEAYLGDHERDALRVMAQDFEATAWFDDVEVIQLPRIELDTNQPGQMIVAPTKPSISVLVQDLTAEQLRAEVTVYDSTGEIVDTMEYPVTGGREPFVWEPRIERFGWYRVGLEATTPMGRVGASYLDFCYLPDETLSSLNSGPASATPTTRDHRRFALMLDRLPPELADAMPHAVLATGSGTVWLPMWLDDARLEDLPEWLDRLGGLIDSLRRSWLNVSLSFARLPPGLAAGLKLDPDAVIEGIATGDDRLERYLLEGLDRFGQRIEWWRLSRPGDTHAGTDDELAEQVSGARALIRSLAPGPQIALGWRADVAPPSWSAGELIQRFEVLLPRGLSPESFGEIIGAWGGGQRSSGPSLSFVIEPGRTEQIGARAVADDVIRRGVESWAVLGEEHDAVGLLSPWVVSEARAGSRAMPSPALAGWRTLTDQLAGRRVTGQWDLGPGVRCLILSPTDPEADGRTGALAVWADSPEGEGRSLRALLSTGDVTVVDTFGNRTIVRATPGEEPHFVQHVVPISSSPVFIEDVDADLVTLQSSVRLNPAKILSTPGEHRHTIELFNPSNAELIGQAVVVSPGGVAPGASLRERIWFITPRSQEFRVRDQRWGELPIDIAFVPAVEAGPMEMVIDLLIQTADQPTWVRTHTPIELGLDTFEVELTLRLSPDAKNALVEVTMTNTSDEDIQLEATAFAPGYPRQRLPSVLLRPGQSLTRLTPPFAGAGERLSGQAISVAVIDRDTRARLNKSVTLP